MIDKHCIECGAHFVALRRTAKYCSDRCRVRRYKHRHPEQAPDAVAPRPCSLCGTEFTPKRRRDTHYCSPRCANRAWRIRQRQARRFDALMRQALTRRFGQKVAA